MEGVQRENDGESGKVDECSLGTGTADGDTFGEIRDKDMGGNSAASNGVWGGNLAVSERQHVEKGRGPPEKDGKTNITSGEANVRCGNTRRAGMVDTERSQNTTTTEILVETGEHEGGQVSEADLYAYKKDQQR